MLFISGVGFGFLGPFIAGNVGFQGINFSCESSFSWDQNILKFLGGVANVFSGWVNLGCEFNYSVFVEGCGSIEGVIFFFNFYLQISG